MEELQSTEILEREILEDARKEAQRVLKAAEDAMQAKSAEREKKITETLDEMEKNYAEQSRLAAVEIMTVLPLDKHRLRAKKIEGLIDAAVENWYGRLSRQSVLALLQQELAKRLAESDVSVGSEGMRALIHKLDRSEAQAILKAVLPGTSCPVEEIHSTAAYPELILETQDARVFASINKTVEFFLSEQRTELVETLLGQI